MDPDIKVHVVLDDWRDPLRQLARIYFQRRDFPGGGWSTLTSDGRTWVRVEEGFAPTDDLGIVLPREAIEPLAQAIDKALGHASHADTESRILREWLAVEQRRVDEALRG